MDNGNTDYIYAGFTKGGDRPNAPNWQFIPNTEEERKKALEAGYDAFTIMSLSHEPGKDKPEPLRRGPLVFDFDCKEDPTSAISDARKFITKLIQLTNLDPNCFRYWISGGKGCHIEIPAVMFGAEAGHPYLHEIYKLLVLLLQKEIWGCFLQGKLIDMQLYCGGKGRLLREENIQRDNGRYKVPVSSEEFLELGYDDLWKLTEQPRPNFETGYHTGEVNSRLSEKYHCAERIVGECSVAKAVQVLEAMCKWSFFCKCVEQAETLDEPEWWAFISNLAPLQELGRELSHYFSRPHPEYTHERTERKFNDAVKERKPKTCEYIRSQGWVQCPSDCHMRVPYALFQVKNIPAPATKFVCKADGLYCNEGETSVKICSPIRVIARGCGYDSWGWCRGLELTDPMQEIKRLILPMKEFAETGTKWLKPLYSAVLQLELFPKATALLKEYIANGVPDSEFVKISDKIGWTPDQGYLLPDDYLGPGNKVIFTSSQETRFQTSGTLEEWQEQVGRYCACNHLLVLVTSYALKGIMLEPISIEGGGLHIYGGSSTGKTTSVYVAGSVCGGGKGGFILQWRTADNALEKIAAAHNDNFLVLDEVSQVSSVALSNLAYMLPNQKGKLRMKSDGENRKQLSWNLNFLSTGELTIGGKIMEDGKLKSHAG